MKPFYILISFILISTASFGQEVIFGKKEGPQFTIDQKEFVIADAVLNETKTVRIPFINDGTEPLIFRRNNASCNCIIMKTPEEVAPGEDAELTISFTPTRTGNYNETIYIQANTKKIPMLFGFKATVE